MTPQPPRRVLVLTADPLPQPADRPPVGPRVWRASAVGRLTPVTLTAGAVGLPRDGAR